MLDDGIAVTRHEDFFARREKLVDAKPLVSDQARRRAGRFKHARRRRKSKARHAVAIDVERYLTGAEERVVIARTDMAGAAHVRRHRLVLPSRAAEQEGGIRKHRRRTEE